ncbi:MAG: hypothetical protein ABIE70_04345 [bacterium]
MVRTILTAFCLLICLLALRANVIAGSPGDGVGDDCCEEIVRRLQEIKLQVAGLGQNHQDLQFIIDRLDLLVADGDCLKMGDVVGIVDSLCHDGADGCLTRLVVAIEKYLDDSPRKCDPRYPLGFRNLQSLTTLIISLIGLVFTVFGIAGPENRKAIFEAQLLTVIGLPFFRIRIAWVTGVSILVGTATYVWLWIAASYGNCDYPIVHQFCITAWLMFGLFVTIPTFVVLFRLGGESLRAGPSPSLGTVPPVFDRPIDESDDDVQQAE